MWCGALSNKVWERGTFVVWNTWEDVREAGVGERREYYFNYVVFN